jgi:hypothetical protein
MDKKNALKWLGAILVTVFEIAIIPVAFMFSFAIILILPILIFIELVKKNYIKYKET